MKLRLSWYDTDLPQDLSDPAKAEERTVWFDKVTREGDQLERALGLVLTLATAGALEIEEHCTRKDCRSCAQLSAALDIVLDACPPAVLAHFDALSSREEEK